MQFDGPSAQLSLVGNTLGSTIFTGFGNAGSFYVRLEDGSFLDPVTGAPILLNGLDASFDGIVPSTFLNNILDINSFSFIEDRLFDADDAALNGRGQIFAGLLPSLDVEDFFNQFGELNFGPNGLNVIITGLPSVVTPNVTAATGASALNLIAPAVGEDDEVVATLTPEELASLEPAAGSEDSDIACWGDAVGAAANSGTAVSYNFGGTFEESLADAAACGAQ